MNEEEKKKIELDIEAKYVGKTEKEFLNRVTYAECLYILTPENEYCDKIIELSVLKICEIIEKQQKQIEELNISLQEEINEKCKLKTELYLNSIPKSKIEIKDLKEKIKDLKEKLYENLDNQKINELGKKYNIKIKIVETLEIICFNFKKSYLLKINNKLIKSEINNKHEYIQSREFERDIKAFLYNRKKEDK